MTAIIKLIITKLWPILIPLILYLIWLIYVRMKTKEGKKPTFGDGPIRWVLLSMLLIAAICFMYLFAVIESNKKTYIPSHIEDGVLMPSRVE